MKNIILQTVASLFIGGVVFYILVPYHSGLGIIAYEYKYVLYALIICILLFGVVRLFCNKVSLLISYTASSSAIILMVFLYPASERLDRPSKGLKESIKNYFLSQDSSAELRSVAPRPKIIFDMFREDKWLVTVDCGGATKSLYVSVTMLGKVQSDTGDVCKLSSAEVGNLVH